MKTPIKLRQLRPSADGKHNRWCGPAVIAAVCDVSTPEAARRIREVTGKRKVTRVSNHDMIETLRRAGVRVQQVPSVDARGADPTLAQWRKMMGARLNASTVYLVNVTGHYMLVQGRRWMDNKVKAPVQWAHVPPPLRARVRYVFQLTEDSYV